MNEIVITLEGEESYRMDEIGNETAKIAPKTVVGFRRSVFESEFFRAGQLNIKTFCMVDIYREEYNGAKTVLLGGKRLTVYRTFERGDRIELYLSERTGNVS